MPDVRVGEVVPVTVPPPPKLPQMLPPRAAVVYVSVDVARPDCVELCASV